MWYAGGVGGPQRRGFNCVYQPLAEGYRGWATASHDEPPRRHEARPAYEYSIWYLSGWSAASSPSRAHNSVPEKAKEHLTENDGASSTRASPRRADHQPHGRRANPAGVTRDGGSLRGALLLLQGGRVEQPDGPRSAPLLEVERVQRSLMQSGAARNRSAPSSRQGWRQGLAGWPRDGRRTPPSAVGGGIPATTP
jgi:hypothetical protein